MLDTYKNLEARGIIGKMMKVGQDGKTIVDGNDSVPGNLVPRPFNEFPKAVRRVKVLEDGTEQIITLVAGSKSEELKIMSDTVELDAPRSPLERERDQLATDLADQQKMSGTLSKQLENALARIEQLAASVEKINAGQDNKPAPAAEPAKGFAALTAEQKATSNVR